MRPYGPDFFDDDALKAEFVSLRQARKALLSGQIAVVAGEGRRIEYSPVQIGDVDHDLREIAAEARARGLEWGGEAGAIGVAFV